RPRSMELGLVRADVTPRAGRARYAALIHTRHRSNDTRRAVAGIDGVAAGSQGVRPRRARCERGRTESGIRAPVARTIKSARRPRELEVVAETGHGPNEQAIRRGAPE